MNDEKRPVTIKKGEKKENEILDLNSLNVENLPELAGWEEKQKQLVEENPYIEITDNKSYEIACKSRTSLLKGRTSIEAQDKLIASKFASFRKSVGEKSKELISITLPHEEKQQSEVKRYEAIKENERLERERIEYERIAGIKSKIENIESNCYNVIQKTEFNTIEKIQHYLFDILNDENDFEEYHILFEQSKVRIEKLLSEKIIDLKEKENQRIKNEELELAIKEANAKAKELQDKIDSDNLEREILALKEKNDVFEVRVKRLTGLDSNFNFNIPEYSFYGYTFKEIYDADAIQFENILTDAKNSIQKAKDELEQIEKQKTIDLENAEKAELEDKELEKKKAKENLARIKRLSNDKKNISYCLELFDLSISLQQIENEESLAFIESANNQISELKKSLIEQLNNL